MRPLCQHTYAGSSHVIAERRPLSLVDVKDLSHCTDIYGSYMCCASKAEAEQTAHSHEVSLRSEEFAATSTDDFRIFSHELTAFRDLNACCG